MKVAVVMGSDSDLPTLEPALETLKEFEVEYYLRVLSAHRTPVEMIEFGKNAHNNGFDVIIAAAGGAAHLPGMLASVSPLPVIGVPVKSSTLSGIDSLYSIVQMPAGVPVATVAIGGGKNAALLAIQILSIKSEKLREKMIQYKLNLEIESKNKNLNPPFVNFI